MNPNHVVCSRYYKKLCDIINGILFETLVLLDIENIFFVATYITFWLIMKECSMASLILTTWFYLVQC